MQLENTNIPIPQQFLSWDYRRSKMTPSINVSYRYTDETDIEICFIAATEMTTFNINWDKSLRTWIMKHIKAIVKSEMSFDKVFEQEHGCIELTIN